MTNRATAIGLLATGWNRGGSGEKRAPLEKVAHAVRYIRDGFAVSERIGGVLDDIEAKAITFGKLLLFICGAILVVLVIK